jgi:UDP-N-acetylmuramoylalanine--D-glutamate ligase
MATGDRMLHGGGVDLATIDSRTIDLLGLGIDVTALLPHLAGAAAIRAWVDDPELVTAAERAACADAGVVIGPVVDWHGGGDVVVRAPGFPRYRADVLPRIDTVPMTTPIDLWLHTHRDHQPTVLVTGTKGKSTVVTMLAAIVENSVTAGNIGVPIWTVDRLSPGRTVICEVSSYQGADTTAVVDLAILTSLSEDHVSWHGSVERYHADKLRPVLAARRVVAPESLATVLLGRSYAGDLRVVTDGPTEPGPLDALPVHVQRNARLALTAAHWLSESFAGVTLVDDPAGVLAELPALPGRLRPLPTTVDHHRWYDDALASNPSGTAAAVDAFHGQPMWLILGGIDRGVDLGPLIEAVAAAAEHAPVSAVAVPDNGADIIAQFVSAGIELAHTDAADGVADAVGLIRREATEPSVVLFSPAAPTPTRHGNWSDRSQAFTDAVIGEPQPLRSTTH